MTINFENLSTAQLIEMKQKCENLLNQRRANEIKEALNKLFSAMEELYELDPDAAIIDHYDWNDLRFEIENTYRF